jgi:histidyl-tRNA synthetase
VLLTCDAEGIGAPTVPMIDVYVLDTTGGDAARDLTVELRRAGFSADRAYDGRSMKSQMKSADRSGARFAVIIGSDELDAGTVTVRPLREDLPQRSIDRDRVLDELRILISETNRPMSEDHP